MNLDDWNEMPEFRTGDCDARRRYDAEKLSFMIDHLATALPGHIRYDILRLLLSSRGRLWTRQEIDARVRIARSQPPRTYDPNVDRSIDVQIGKLRREGYTIETVRAEYGDPTTGGYRCP